jgi:CsoR family transcriptional regulator, copper-sensing transcriptional repressor
MTTETAAAALAADATAPCACGARSKGRRTAIVDPAIRSTSLKLLRRAQGQIRAIEEMVKNDRPCVDVLVQLSSAHGALRAAGRAVMRNHLKHCATQATAMTEPRRVEAMYDELMDLLFTHLR